ncbi:MAG: rhombotarget lipoprotein [Synoicihabitans sp.]
METSPAKTYTPRIIAIAALVTLLLIALTGCTIPTRSTHRSSSVVEFLYPGGEQPFVTPTVPTLNLPLRVGVAFVPSTQRRYQHSAQSFPETQKMELLEKVSAQFEALPFVAAIEEIPDTYLRRGGSFENLDQIQSLMGVDVMVLIAHDQMQGRVEDEWSFAYWTIVGAYIVPASKNETHTLMEAVVYDIRSRSLLFRAPGASVIKGRSSLVGSGEEMQDASENGFSDAATDLTTNLADQLERFKTRLKEEPEAAIITHKPGYTGAGSWEGWFGGIFAMLGLVQIINRSRQS